MSEEIVKATYKLECKEGRDVCQVADKIAKQQSTGEWKHFKLPDGACNFTAKTYSVSANSESQGTVAIEFPIDNFDTSTANIPALLNVLGGDIFGWDVVESVRLEDISLPQSFVKLFPGPRFGPKRISEMLGVEENLPLFGVTIKPSLGLSPEQFADMCRVAAENGADFITDDEKLVNPSYCTIEHRAEKVSDTLKKIETKIGKKLLYIINISCSANKICSVAKKVMRYPYLGLMVSFVTGGYGCLQAIAEDESVNAPIWAHRTMHAAFSRESHGISLTVIAKLCRLAGADFQHIGPVGGRDVVVKGHAITQKNVMTRTRGWFGLKQSLPVVTGGVNPGNVHDTVDLLGCDIAFAVGSAVVDHPDGFRDGVIAMRQAIDCVMEGLSSEECYDRYSEFQKSVDSYERVPRLE